MSKILLVAEKPDVAKTIAGYLGAPKQGDVYENEKYVVANCAGHLVNSPLPTEKATLPFFFPMRYSPSQDKQRLLNTLETQMTRNDVSLIINACDAGREGEPIFWRVYDYVKCTKPFKRLWQQDATKSGFFTAMSKLLERQACENRYAASNCRDKADSWIGVNGSRSVFKAVGRVKTPTLNFVVEAYLNNKNFVPKDYWEISGVFHGGKGNFKSRLYDDKGEKIRKLETKEGVDALLQAFNLPIPCTIKDVGKEQKSEPPLLFDGTDLQKEAFRRFGYSVDKTLAIQQKLYDDYKALSYPRSDYKHLSVSMGKPDPDNDNTIHMVEVFNKMNNSPQYSQFSQFILNNQRINTKNKRIFDDSKVKDHYAVIPTGVILLNGVERPLDSVSPADLALVLLPEEMNILDLVIRRTLAAFMPPAIYSKTERTIKTENGYTFKVSGRVLVSEGWLAVYGKTKAEDDEEDGALPPIDESGKGELVSLTPMALKTKAPPLLNDGTLVDMMKKAGKEIDDEDLSDILDGKGIGTAATRPNIIKELKATRKTATGEKPPFISTDSKGNLIPSQEAIDLCLFLKDVAPMLISPELTANMEKKLMEIENGQYTVEQFDAYLRDFISQFVEDIKSKKDALPQAQVQVAGKNGGCMRLVICSVLFEDAF